MSAIPSNPSALSSAQRGTSIESDTKSGKGAPAKSFAAAVDSSQKFTAPPANPKGDPDSNATRSATPAEQKKANEQIKQTSAAAKQQLQKEQEMQKELQAALHHGTPTPP